MGQSFNKNTAGTEEAKARRVKKCYEDHFEDKEFGHISDFYRAICSAVEDLNQVLGYTQVKAIDEKTLKQQYDKYCNPGKPKPTKEDFDKIMAELLEKNFEVTGMGVKDTLLYIFGVPASATFIKNAIMPGLVSNEVLIPSMTSLTVLVLAKLNKI